MRERVYENREEVKRDVVLVLGVKLEKKCKKRRVASELPLYTLSILLTSVDLPAIMFANN